MGWAGSLLWPLQVLNIAIWGTNAIAAHIRYPSWQISAGVIAIGVSLYLLRVYYLLPPSALLLGAVHADNVADRQDTVEIKAAFDEFNAAFRHLDWKRLRNTFAADATMFSPSPRSPKRLNGIVEIEKAMKPMFDGNKERRAARGGKAPEAKPASAIGLKIQQFGDTAIVTFQPEASFGPERRALTRRTLVLKHDAGKWLIVHLHGSNTELLETIRLARITCSA